MHLHRTLLGLLLLLAVPALLAVPHTARAHPLPEPGVPPSADGSGANTLPFGFDFLPYVGMSSADSRARRQVSLNLIGGISGGSDLIEVGGVFNLDRGEIRGLQVAGVTNVVGGSAWALQIAGVMNVAREDSSGFQIALVNSAGGAYHGAQIGQVNLASGGIEGAQIGLLNIAGADARGAQVGIVNVSHGLVRGLQIGLLNISRRAGAGIGLLNIFTEGYVDLHAFGSDEGLMMVGLRHGSGPIYNIYFAGARLNGGTPVFASGFGVGYEKHLTPSLSFSLDGTATHLPEQGFVHADNLYKLRPMLTLRLGESVAIYGGPTASLQLITRPGPPEVVAPLHHWMLTGDDAPVHLALWPGFTAGLRVF